MCDRIGARHRRRRMARAQKRANGGRASRGLIAAVAMFSVAAACAVTGAEATFHVSSELGADLPASAGIRAGPAARVATTGARDDHPAVPHGDDCAMMKLVVDFAQHRGRQATHARFDVRAIHHDAVPAGVQDHLGTLIGSSSAEGPVTIVERMCLPRDQGYVLIASGNATRGSSFDRFNVTVINEEYLDLVAFRAGSDWTRGSSFRSDRLAASGAGASSAQLGSNPHAEDYEVEFFEDEGVGAPLFDSPDGGKTYRLHGRARFDVWPEAPIDANGVWTECGVLAAVSVGATSYGNGAAPSRHVLGSLGQSRRRCRHGRSGGGPARRRRRRLLHLGLHDDRGGVPATGEYEFIAEDGGDLNRGWGFGTAVEVTEIVLDENTRSMRQRKIAHVDAPTWFTGGRRQSLGFHVDEADAVVEAAARALQPKTAPTPATPATPAAESNIVEIETHDTILQDDGTGRDEEEEFVVEPTVIDAMDETRSAGARLARPADEVGSAEARQHLATGASTPARAGTRASPAAWRGPPSGKSATVNTRRTLLAAADPSSPTARTLSEARRRRRWRLPQPPRESRTSRTPRSASASSASEPPPPQLPPPRSSTPRSRRSSPGASSAIGAPPPRRRRFWRWRRWPGWSRSPAPR